MTTPSKRLCDDDVRAIFESLHGNHLPPSHLEIKIVPVGPDGLRLSPPSYEFEDGLYVLLKPDKKRTISGEWYPDTSNVPSHLKTLTLLEVPEQICPWSLSGPQFPQPTAIQQRYCYPKGNHNYSSRKGGALWTMYDSTGKEDMNFRLLHVYFSAKRAVNKGVRVSQQDRMSIKKQRPFSTPRRRRTPSNNFSPCSTPGRTIHPTVTTSQTNSPLVMATSNKPGTNPSTTFLLQQASVTDNLERSFLGHTLLQPIQSFEVEDNIDDKASTIQTSDFQTLERKFRSDDCNWRQLCTGEDPEIAQLLIDADSVMDVASYWDDPVFGLVMKPSSSSIDQNDPCKALKHKLNFLHERITTLIMATPENKNPMIEVFVDWARDLTKTPLKPQESDDTIQLSNDVKLPPLVLEDVSFTRTKSWSIVEDEMICRLYEKEGPNWTLMSQYLGRTTSTIKERHQTLRQRFEKSVNSVNLTTTLVGHIQAMKQSQLLKKREADVLILKHLADYITNGKKLNLDRDFVFGPFRVVTSPGDFCGRCCLPMPSFETGRTVCKRTGWCETCVCLSVCVSGDYIRQLHLVRRMATLKIAAV